MEDYLKTLKGIKRVEAPPLLYKRIQQKIQNERSDRVSLRTVYTVAASFIILLSINAFVMTQSRQTISDARNFAESLQLIADNNLYK